MNYRLLLVFILPLYLLSNTDLTLSKVKQKSISIESIVARIESEKTTISDFIKKNTKAKKNLNLYYIGGRNPNGVYFSFRPRKVVFFRGDISDSSNTLIYSSNESNNDIFKVTVVLEEDTFIDKNGYNYAFKFIKNENAVVDFYDKNLSEKIRISNSTYNRSRDFLEVNRLLKEKLLKSKFFETKNKKSYISFTMDEISFLSQNDNYNKLKTKLKSSGLL
jgi:hypothetical protein